MKEDTDLSIYKVPICCRLLLFAIICVPALMFMTYMSTILHPYMESDYCIFTVVGQGWINGAIPYADLFDHKGPVLFFIQMVANSIGIGKAGIWIFELIFAVITFELIFQCGREFKLSERDNYIAFFVCYIFYFLYVEDGNTVEEWSLPFQLLPMLLSIRYFIGTCSRIKEISALSGICFGLVTMMRINNNYIICGLALGFLIHFIQTKQYKTLLMCIVCFMGGVIIGIAPWIIYFSYKDSLYDMLYATFIFNIHYKSTFSQDFASTNIIKLLPCFILPIITYFYDKAHNTNFFITFLLLSVIGFFVFLTGLGYSHYFLMILPIVALSLHLSSGMKNVTRFAIVLCILTPILIGFRNHPTHAIEFINKNRIEAQRNIYRDPIQTFLEQNIPQCDLDSIYTYGDSRLAKAIVSTGRFPIGKYFVFQEFHSKVDEYTYNDVRHKFEEANPKWVLATDNIMRSKVLEGKLNTYVEIPIDSLPEIFHKNHYRLYRRN